MDRNSLSRESEKHSPSKSTRNSKAGNQAGRTPGTGLRPSLVALDRIHLRSSPVMLDRPGARLRPSPVMLDTGSRRSQHRLFGREGWLTEGEASRHWHPARKEQSIEKVHNRTRNQLGTLPVPLQRSRASAASASASASSLLRSTHDQEMASRQSRIESLPPIERQKQEEWAQKQLQIAGHCIAGWKWGRIQGGYRCHGGFHMVTDELLAEGKGAFYAASPFIIRGQPKQNSIWAGPIYGKGIPDQLGSLRRDKFAHGQHIPPPIHGMGGGSGGR